MKGVSAPAKYSEQIGVFCKKFQLFKPAIISLTEIQYHLCLYYCLSLSRIF